MEKRSYKKSIIIGTAYLLIIAAIAVFMFNSSGAKYISRINGYTSIEPSFFNAVILGKTTEDNLRKNINNDTREIYKFKESITLEEISGYLPGMEKDSETNPCKKIRFTVANGESYDDLADLDLIYNVCVRTTGNLPLKFSLSDVTVTSSTDPGSGETTTTESYDIYKMYSEPEEIDDSIENSADDDFWYEYSFVDESKTPEEGSEFVEPEFTLSSEELNLNTHEIIVEWPIENEEGGGESGDGGEGGESDEKPCNSSDYMKEVDILEIVVYASTANNKTPDKDRGSEGEAYHASGRIIVTPLSSGTFGQRYGYEADFRGFTERLDLVTSETENIYSFTVDNGIGIAGNTQYKDYTYYTVRLLVPYNSDTQDISFSLRVKDKDNYYGLGSDYFGTLEKLKTEYWLCNIKYDESGYGTFTEKLTSKEAADTYAADYKAALAAPNEYESIDLNERLYSVIYFKWAEGVTSGPNSDSEAVMMLRNKVPDAVGVKTDYFEKNEYELVASDVLDGEKARDNVYTILVDAIFVDQAASGETGYVVNGISDIAVDTKGGKR